MSIRIAFEGGPADGVVQDYPALDRALPSLYWGRDEPIEAQAVYHRSQDTPDAESGIWRYHVVTSPEGAAPF